MPWALPVPQRQLILTSSEQIPGLQRFASGGKTTRRREPLRQPRDRAPHLTQREAASPQKRRPRKYRSRRPARPRFGMMALTDASRHDGSKAAAPPSPSSAFRTTPPVRSSPLTPTRSRNTLGYLRALHAMITLTAFPSVSTATATPSSSATIPTGPSPNSSPKTISHPTRTRPRRTRIQQSPPLSPAKGRIERAWRTCRTVWSATSPRPCHHFARSQHRARPLLRRLQPALRPAPRRCRARLPLPAPPLRSRPLPQLALSTRRRRRSHRHPRRELHRPAALARPSRLCRRNRRTCASSGRQSARLSRRPASAHAASAARRQPSRPSSDLGAEKERPSLHLLSPAARLAAVLRQGTQSRQ